MRRTIPLILLFSLCCISVLAIGCKSESADARAEAARRVAEAMRGNRHLKMAMEPMYGRWAIDVNSTMAENTDVPANVMQPLRADLIENPFTLTITEDEYVSKSERLMRQDRYATYSVAGQTVTILLGVEEGAENLKDYEVFGRKTTLRLRDGKLLNQPPGPVTMVFSRVTESD